MHKERCIREEGAKGGRSQDLGPPMLLAVVAPPGSGAYTKYTHDRGHDGLQTGGTRLYDGVGEAPLSRELPRVLGIGIFWGMETREMNGNRCESGVL